MSEYYADKAHEEAQRHMILKYRWLDHAKEAEKNGNLQERDKYLAMAAEEDRESKRHLANARAYSRQVPPGPGEVEEKLKAQGFTFPGFPKP